MSYLAAYLQLESVMVEMDALGDEELGDSIRDAMDVLWCRLNKDEIKILNDRR